MVIGIDTYHDSARRGQSVMGFIASTNSRFTRYIDVLLDWTRSLVSCSCQLLLSLIKIWPISFVVGDVVAKTVLQSDKGHTDKGSSIHTLMWLHNWRPFTYFSQTILCTCFRYFSQCTFQPVGSELGDKIKTCMVNALRKYQDINRCLPDRILVFRDGVGDGQVGINLCMGGI